MKRNDELLGSGSWYFVNIRDADGEINKRIMDEKEYSDFFRQLNGDGKFVQIRWTHYFWSNIHSFWSIEFEEGVLSQIKQMLPDAQEFIKKQIRCWVDVGTMDRLRSQISYFLSR